MPSAPTRGPVHLQTADPPRPCPAPLPNLPHLRCPLAAPHTARPSLSVHLGPNTWAAFSRLVMFPCSLAPPGPLCTQKHLHLPSLWRCHGGSEGSPPIRLCSSAARLGIRSAHPGRSLQRKAGGGHPAGPALPALRPGGALHQCHRQRRGPEDAVSTTTAAPARDPLTFPQGTLAW